MEHDGVVWLVIRHHLCTSRALIPLRIDFSNEIHDYFPLILEICVIFFLFLQDYDGNRRFWSLFTLQVLFLGLILCKYCVFYGIVELEPWISFLIIASEPRNCDCLSGITKLKIPLLILFILVAIASNFFYWFQIWVIALLILWSLSAWIIFVFWPVSDYLSGLLYLSHILTRSLDILSS